MHGVIQVGHRLVGTVNRQRVLNQVIGSHRQEIKILQEHLEREGCCGYFNHGADFDGAVSHAPVVKFDAGMVNQGHGVANFAGMHQHGNQQVGLPVDGRTQNRAQLGQKHGGVGQTPANGAQTQGRIHVRLVFQGLVQRFVGTDIYGADGDRQAFHAFNGALVSLVLLFFVGQFSLAAHE